MYKSSLYYLISNLWVFYWQGLAYAYGSHLVGKWVTNFVNDKAEMGMGKAGE